MADERPLFEQILDVAVFAPVGAAMLAGEQLPTLVAKGRTVVGNRVTVARMVGRLAVGQMRRKVEDALGGAASTTPAHRAGGAGVPDRAAPEKNPPDETAPDESGPDRSGPTHPGPHRAAPDRPAAAVHVPDAGDLAIPGYDSLAASQVVRRLDGLTAAELATVQAYEEATRGRRTVLGRIAQLQGRAHAGA